MKVTFELNPDFTCTHCRNFVSAGSMFAGVNHRNHCPYCLWSRHMDLINAGDRMSACKAPMEPIGLTLKRVTKKYPSASGGELMLIHLCTECGQISINRIAADDDPEGILDVFNASTAHPAGFWDSFKDRGISPLGHESIEKVYQQLFGHQAKPVLAGEFTC